MSIANGDLQTIKLGHILEMTSYCHIHRPFSTWRFWVHYEVKTVIKFWIC